MTPAGRWGWAGKANFRLLLAGGVLVVIIVSCISSGIAELT
jgi:hypothetical protein